MSGWLGAFPARFAGWYDKFSLMDEISRIISILKRTFEQDAWHGPSVMETLKDVSETECQKRLPGTHSIGELVLHMTAWRIFVIKKLEGDDEFTVSEELNFPEMKKWKDAVIALQNSQAALLEAIGKFDPARLQNLVPYGRHEYTYYTLIHGIIHHDAYHTGQIVLIKKA